MGRSILQTPPSGVLLAPPSGVPLRGRSVRQAPPSGVPSGLCAPLRVRKTYRIQKAYNSMPERTSAPSLQLDGRGASRCARARVPVSRITYRIPGGRQMQGGGIPIRYPGYPLRPGGRCRTFPCPLLAYARAAAPGHDIPCRLAPIRFPIRFPRWDTCSPPCANVCALPAKC